MEDRTADSNENVGLRFALLMKMNKTDGKYTFSIHSENEGIPDADVVLTVQAWVEKISTHLKEQRVHGLKFGAN